MWQNKLQSENPKNIEWFRATRCVLFTMTTISWIMLFSYTGYQRFYGAILFFYIIFYRPGIKTWKSLKTVLEQSKIGAQGSFIRRKIIPQVNWVHFYLLQFFLLISRWRNFTKEPMNVRWTDYLLCLSSSNLPISVISLFSVLCVNSTARNVLNRIE